LSNVLTGVRIGLFVNLSIPVKVIALLEDGDFGLPLQFTNFRD
jgi:hypothetical protein